MSFKAFYSFIIYFSFNIYNLKYKLRLFLFLWAVMALLVSFLLSFYIVLINWKN